MNIIETERVLHQGIQQSEAMWAMMAVTIWGLNAVTIGALAKVGWNAIQERRRAAFVRRTLRIAQETDQTLTKGEISGLLTKLPISQFNEETANLVRAAIARTRDSEQTRL